MILTPGQEVGRFVVEGVVGEGGMATVYRVRHAQLGSVFALKLLTTPNDTVRRRMLNEGRIQATLRHPNIVSVVDVVEVNGVTGLLMEYIRGPSLDTFMRHHRPSTEDAIALFAGVLAGVGAAHERGLIHRDLKPANVLIQPGEDGVRPKVTDFGIAKDVRDPSLSATRVGTTMGTPSYVAPEQIEDASSVDERADIWSLGCILYELLTGQKAFDGPNALRILNHVMTGDFIPVRDLEPDVPEHIAEVVAGCLTLKRDRRLASCADVRLRLGLGRENSLPTLVPSGSDSARAVDSLTFQTPAGAMPRVAGQGTLGLAAATQPMVSMLEAWPSPLPAPEPDDPTLVPFAKLALVVSGVAALNAVIAFAFAPALPVAWWFGAPTEDVLPEEVGGDTEESAPRADASPAPEGPAAPAEPTVGDGPALTPPPRRRLNPFNRPEPEPAGTDAPLPPPEGTGGSEPETAPEPDRRAQKPARIRVVGDAKKVMLTARGEYWSSSQRIPPGTYEIVAWFNTPEPLRAGTVTLEAGQKVRIVCHFDRGRCEGETE